MRRRNNKLAKSNRLNYEIRKLYLLIILPFNQMAKIIEN